MQDRLCIDSRNVQQPIMPEIVTCAAAASTSWLRGHAARPATTPAARPLRRPAPRI